MDNQPVLERVAIGRPRTVESETSRKLDPETGSIGTDEGTESTSRIVRHHGLSANVPTTGFGSFTLARVPTGNVSDPENETPGVIDGMPE